MWQPPTCMHMRTHERKEKEIKGEKKKEKKYSQESFHLHTILLRGLLSRHFYIWTEKIFYNKNLSYTFTAHLQPLIQQDTSKITTVPCSKMNILYTYTASHEERSVFWEVIGSAIISKKVYMYVSYSKRFLR
jgi:hypothetical protein